MFFIKKNGSNEIKGFDTPDQVATFLLGKSSTDYQIFYAKPLALPTGEDSWYRGMKKFLEGVVEKWKA